MAETAAEKIQDRTTANQNWCWITNWNIDLTSPFLSFLKSKRGFQDEDVVHDGRASQPRQPHFEAGHAFIQFSQFDEFAFDLAEREQNAFEYVHLFSFKVRTPSSGEEGVGVGLGHHAADGIAPVGIAQTAEG